MAVVSTQKTSSCPPYYPTACFELLHASTGSYVVAALQFLLLILVGVTYYFLERRHYFVNVDAFRPVVACMGTLYAAGTICAVIGVFQERRSLVHAHVTIVTSLMVFTDIIAIVIVIIMAIGNRLQYTHKLPQHFVDEHKFYAVLGPFWMYLGAIMLHILVAVNMCFLQVFNSFIGFLDDKLSPKNSPVNLNRKHINEKVGESKT